jgi:hypothetical protein
MGELLMPKSNHRREVEEFLTPGAGGATHQSARSAEQILTTNQGTAVSDNQNTLKSGERGPSLLEDFHFREKITHFDHEHIPQRIVHARGSGAHGYFEVTKPVPHLTSASFLANAGKKTEAFARFSTVVGGAAAGLTQNLDEGVIELSANGLKSFPEAAKRQRGWDRERSLQK